MHKTMTINSKHKLVISIVLLHCFVFVSHIINAQVWIPVTASDALSCERFSQNIKAKAYHSSVTWKVTVKDNIISRTKVLFSETFYNSNGQPAKIIYFGEGNKPKNYTIVKYNSRNLPFEEVKFTADSVMIGGTLYEYNSSNQLVSQIMYLGDSVLCSYEIKHLADSIVVSEVDSRGKIISSGLISSITDEQKELVFRKAVEHEISQNNYDILSEVTQKHIVGNAYEKVFIYDNDQIVKTAIFNNNHEEISSASFEYNISKNISRIIERRDKEGVTNVYMINYR